MPAEFSMNWQVWEHIRVRSDATRDAPEEWENINGARARFGDHNSVFCALIAVAFAFVDRLR